MKKSLSSSGEEGKDRLAAEPSMGVKDTEPTQLHQLIELPDRKEITLCEAVTAFIHGKVCDLRQRHRDRPIERIDTGFAQIHALTNRTGTGEETTEPVDTSSRRVENLLERLQSAAYAGRVKFRAIKEYGDPAYGYEDIDPLYFYIKPLFNWPHDVIVHPEDESSTPWYFVHLDREQFVSLLSDMGISVQQSLDPDVKGERKTFRTGVAGRPTSKHLVMKEAQRRLDAGNYPELLKTFSEELENWLKVAEPEAAPMTAKTIQNNLRELWRRHKPPKIIDPS
jgi:hypothetical protein